MTRAEYAKSLSSLAVLAASWARDQAEMVVMDGAEGEVEITSVAKMANEMRERLLWIERQAHNIR